MKAVLCPVCNGKGRTHFYDSTGTLGEECHACNGKGYLWSPEGVYGDYSPYVDKCPACGGDRNSSPLTGCPMGSHYGTYCGEK